MSHITRTTCIDRQVHGYEIKAPTCKKNLPFVGELFLHPLFAKIAHIFISFNNAWMNSQFTKKGFVLLDLLKLLYLTFLSGGICWSATSGLHSTGRYNPTGDLTVYWRDFN